jgi:hypothetical protein
MEYGKEACRCDLCSTSDDSRINKIRASQQKRSRDIKKQMLLGLVVGLDADR